MYHLHFLHQADERWYFHSCEQVMSLKYHIIHFIVKDMEKQLEIDKKKVKPKQFQNYQGENLLQLVSNFKF